MIKDGTTGGNQREQFGFVNGNSVTVIPDKRNDASTSSPTEVGYGIDNNKYCDPVEGKIKDFQATIHTHPKDDFHPKAGNSSSGDDLERLRLNYPNRIGFTLGLGDGKVWGLDWKGTFPTNVTVKDIKMGTKLPIYDKENNYYLFILLILLLIFNLACNKKDTKTLFEIEKIESEFEKGN